MGSGDKMQGFLDIRNLDCGFDGKGLVGLFTSHEVITSFACPAWNARFVFLWVASVGDSIADPDSAKRWQYRWTWPEAERGHGKDAS